MDKQLVVDRNEKRWNKSEKKSGSLREFDNDTLVYTMSLFCYKLIV